jgi:hypothetical protein
MDEETKPKRKAKDNPWYRLATFHGEPAAPDDEVAAKNRVTWNRWMAPRIPDDLRAALLEKGHTLKELEPLPEDKFQKIGSQLGISAEALIDFSDTEFEALFANGLNFPAPSLLPARPSAAKRVGPSPALNHATPSLWRHSASTARPSAATPASAA